MRRALLALLAGGALTLSFPGSGIWVLAPVGVGALALATRGTSIRTGAGLGLLAGLACFLPTLSWTGTYVGALPWVALAILQALYVAFAGAVSSALQRGVSVAGADRVRPFVVALAWVGSEALRARTPYGGFPWARIAFTQADSPLAHVAALAGAPGVTFAVALAGGVLASAVAPRATLSAPTDLESPGAFSTRVGVAGSTRSRVVAMPRWRRLGVAVVLVVSPLAVPLYSEGRPADVMAVQGNVPHPGLDFNAERRAVLDNHVSATTRAAAQVRAGSLTQPDLVVWPENSSDIDPVRNTDAALQVNLALEAIRAPLLIGTLRIGDDRSVRNVAELYEAGRGLVAEYTKRHPVPFAEYIPNRAFFRLFSDKVDLLTRDFSAGSAPGLFDVPATSGPIRVGTTICFEVAYDDLVRDVVDRGATLLIVQTNNATFGYTAESEQQLAISRLRAIEHGRSVVHISTVGVSALITPDGTPHGTTSLFTQAVLSEQLPLRSELTIATRLGPLPEYAACLGLVLLLGAAWRRSAGGRRR